MVLVVPVDGDTQTRNTEGNGLPGRKNVLRIDREDSQASAAMAAERSRDIPLELSEMEPAPDEWMFALDIAPARSSGLWGFNRAHLWRCSARMLWNIRNAPCLMDRFTISRRWHRR